METPYFPENVPMPSGSSPVPIEALLAHQGFVRALARQLVSDPHAADDLAQETWLKASASPPREHASLTGWFARVLRNRASNVRRDTHRRTARERDVARSESIEPTDVAERVELEARVVRAVLALREPYRGVILGRYYEDTSTAELARRQGVTESSVRSQETRALELLRRELDETFDGGRAAWSALLAPLATRDAVASTGVPLAYGFVLAGVGVVALTTWAVRDAATEARGVELAHESTDDHITLRDNRVESGSVVDGVADGDGVASLQSRDVDLAREPASPPDRVSTIAMDATRAELDTLAVEDLLRLALHTQAALRAKLLTPDAELAARYTQTGANGVMRILRREIFGSWARHDPLGLREGGSYCGFESDSHDYDAAWNISFQDGHFQAGSDGAIVDLPGVELDQVPTRADVFVPEWNETTRALWTLCWREPIGDGRYVDPQFGHDHHALIARARQGKAEVGRTHLLRSRSAGVADKLYAFQSIAADEHGQTLAWRKLHEWPIANPNQNGTRKPRTISTPQLGRAPEWMTSASIVQLLDWLERVRASATSKVLAVPAEIEAEYLPLFADHHGEVVKLVKPGPFNALVSERWGGSELSFFIPRARDLPRHGTTLRLDGTYMEVGIWGGDEGWELDLGPLPLGAVTTAERVPDTLAPADRDVWEFLWEARADGNDESLLAPDTQARARAFDRDQKPRVGHTFLMRSIRADDSAPELAHDLTVALHVVARDEYGFIVAWRVLRELPPPAPR